MMKIEDWFPIAYHEAAHAVVIVSLGGFVDRAFIRRDFGNPYVDGRGRPCDCVGMVEGGKFYNPLGVNWKRVLQAEPEKDQIFKAIAGGMKGEIITRLAGPWAEADLCLPRR